MVVDEQEALIRLRQMVATAQGWYPHYVEAIKWALATIDAQAKRIAELEGSIKNERLLSRLMGIEDGFHAGASIDAKSQEDQIAALEEKVEALGRQLEFDRTAVADCLSAALKAIDSRHWLTEGRGPYEWNDDKWHEEFYAAAVEIRGALAPLAKIAANWKDCPQTGEQVAQARVNLEAENRMLREALQGIRDMPVNDAIAMRAAARKALGGAK